MYSLKQKQQQKDYYNFHQPTFKKEKERYTLCYCGTIISWFKSFFK